MKYRLIIRPEAEDDLKQAFSWYEGQRKGLGYDFLLQVEAGLKFVEKYPKIFAEEYKGKRIIYLLKKEEVIVLAIAHGKRSPNLIKKRRDKF
ncbi:type II toxin-antitoxin system RelE/ParE family toxin [candidate division KSB1 bacterium]|nr:type II toxin-antitoxin system RelE/ParE family toxin [candidate division KSB1 bacterium]NIR72310.1 type II toxin-antitoxin system RelE/ParE family toxin [candidate division KSB1 bacterium]NIS26702.1 type II toxin-antitoxin system RelE/ParE family toxin [candidate division KSB1 bacterium]NIT70338.1 type II toxin-antitoxin system RelE/ParE family toxin [candidate division KSB1 bacterium]NIU27317.1 type II toxin-antitoxin system RelE/ParE family toxin [candidate division KSB1 bacterium]